jgi:hypothetical protein
MTTYYPLAVGNVWTYRLKDGKTFTNTVIATDGQHFTMQNSMQPQPQYVQKDGDTYLADNYEAGNFQVLMKDNLKKGDAWDIKYKANGIDSVLKMSVKETGLSKDVEGQTYPNVMQIEGDMKMSMNGRPLPMSYQVQYYYAEGVGLILTTASHGDAMGLVAYELK